jgi:hypothetical protein
MRRLHELEAFFARLKLVTGANSMEQMAEKFSSQRVNKIELEKDVSEAERRLAAAKKDLKDQEKAIQDLKSANSDQSSIDDANGVLIEKLVLYNIYLFILFLIIFLWGNSLESDAENARSDLKLARAEAKRLSSTLVKTIS